MSTEKASGAALDEESIAAGFDTSLARALFAKLMFASRNAGVASGREVAYADIVGELQTALNEAESALTRSPKSALLMAEVMAVQKLIAHFKPASDHFKEKADEYSGVLNLLCEQIGVAPIFDTPRKQRRGA